MGFLKTIRKSKRRTSKSKNELKGYGVPKPIPHVDRKRKKKCGKTKYTGASSIKSEKRKNLRVYMFEKATKDSWTDDDSRTISTTSINSDPNRYEELGPMSPYASAIRLHGLSLRQIRTCASSDSVSSPLSSFTASSDDTDMSGSIEMRDDITEVILRMCESRDVNTPEVDNEVMESIPPLLPPPPRYVSDPNISIDDTNDETNDDTHIVDTTHISHEVPLEHSPETRKKSLPLREIRRNASEGSRDFVHVFHQPLSPLEEDASLYSGDDADDEICNDGSNERSAPKLRTLSRRGSMSSTEDESVLKQRWEYGLAVMAQMGMNAIGNILGPSVTDTDASINILHSDQNYDENNSEEI